MSNHRNSTGRKRPKYAENVTIAMCQQYMKLCTHQTITCYPAARTSMVAWNQCHCPPSHKTVLHPSFPVVSAWITNETQLKGEALEQSSARTGKILLPEVGDPSTTPVLQIQMCLSITDIQMVDTEAECIIRVTYDRAGRFPSPRTIACTCISQVCYLCLNSHPHACLTIRNNHKVSIATALANKHSPERTSSALSARFLVAIPGIPRYIDGISNSTAIMRQHRREE